MSIDILSLKPPVLLPWIPVRSFAAKGAVLGALWAAAWIFLNTGEADPARLVAWPALFTALSAFLAMNFTGSSTYRSFSGVVAEMRVAVPLIAAVADRKAAILDKDACMECGACARNCPVRAISVRAGVGCAYAVILGKLSGTEPSCGCGDEPAAGGKRSSCCGG